MRLGDSFPALEDDRGSNRKHFVPVADRLHGELGGELELVRGVFDFAQFQGDGRRNLAGDDLRLDGLRQLKELQGASDRRAVQIEAVRDLGAAPVVKVLELAESVSSFQWFEV